MSIKLMSEVFALSLRPAEKLVLLALADHANDQGDAWPSVETLAKKSSTSSRTVLRILKELESSGWLTRQKRSRKNGSRTSSLYRLALGDKLSPRAPDDSFWNDTADVTNQAANRPLSTSAVTTRTIKPNLKRKPSLEEIAHGLTRDLSEVAEDMLTSLPRVAADQVRREWLARLSVGGVNSPIRYLSALIKQALTGAFHVSIAPISNEGRSMKSAARRSDCLAVAEHLAEMRSKLAPKEPKSC